MNLVFDIATSAEFWRQVYPANRAPNRSGIATPREFSSTWEEISELLPNWVTPRFLEPLDGRIHVLALSTDLRRRSKHHVTHVWNGALPDESFYDLGNGTFVESPAFMFLSAASLLSTVRLIAFGCELCGLYGFDKAEKRGFRTRTKPLLTIPQLRAYLANAQGCRGYSKAMAALPHIVENSASPMETYDVLFLTLPYRLGGYRMPQPSMNHMISLTPRAARIAKRSRCFLDIGYVEESLDIEHHGKLDHSSPEDQASDRARVNALKEMGIEVIELTNDQVGDPQTFEYIVQRIAKILRKRIRKEHLGATDPRVTLRKELRAWNLSSGRLR